jgi:hypothetical protein
VDSMSGNWLPITDYSAKYKVSVSTLRRRIKTADIKYRFFEGKYLLLDEPVTTHSPHRPSLASEIVNEAPQSRPPNASEQSGTMAALNNQPPPSEEKLDGPILSAANRLLTELKKAYTQILQEKEEQILQLREEVTDLKTLVRVLEAENDKLNQVLFASSPYKQKQIDI